MKHHQDGHRRNRHQATFQPLDSKEARHCQVYVIELDASVIREPAFVAKNPKHAPSMPSYYVGMTSIDPEERFLQHYHGTKNVSMICHKYCRKLRMDLVPYRKPTRRKWAMRLEKRVTKELRRQGCGAWMG